MVLGPSAQAAAYIQASGGSLAAYLRLFRQRRDAMLARGEPTGYGKTAATTWSLAFGQLEQSAPAAVGLLRLLACYAPEAIPLPLLLQARPGRPGQLGAQVAAVLGSLLDGQLAASDAIAALRRYSPITHAGAGSVSVHRLVQAVTADQMAAELAGPWRQAAAALIEAAIPADTDAPEGWPACAALLPHAEAALADDSPGMARLANYLGARGSYAAALELQQRVLHAQERVLGPEHPSTLAARHNLAYRAGRRGMRPRPATSSPSCCPSANGSSAPNTQAPWSPVPRLLAGPAWPEMRPGPATSSPCRPS